MTHVSIKSPLPPALREKEDPTKPSNCTHCEQQIFLRQHSLSSALLFALKKIKDINMTEVRPALANDMAKFGRNVYCTYTSLKYWGLIVPDDKGWRITEEGEAFLANELYVELHLWVYNDEVREKEGAEYSFVKISDLEEYIPSPTRETARANMVGLENT